MPCPLPLGNHRPRFSLAEHAFAPFSAVQTYMYGLRNPLAGCPVSFSPSVFFPHKSVFSPDVLCLLPSTLNSDFRPLSPFPQADKTIHIPWTAIWTPLWVCDAFLLFILWFMVFLGRRSPAEGLEEEWRDDLPARVLNAVQLSCNVLFQVFLTLKLDKVVPWDWSRIFAPWLAWEGIQLFRNLTVTSTGGGPTPFATSAEEGVLLRAMAVRQAMLGLQHGVLRIVFCALAILRLDEKIRVTWWVVFTPLWLFFATQFVGICVEYALAKRLQEGLIAAATATAAERGGSVMDPETGEVELGPEEAMIQEQTELMASRASMLACQAAIVLVMALLGVARIEGAHFSVFLVFLPVFVIVGCFTCSLGCAVCCVRDADGIMDGENRPLNPGAGGQGTASATSIGTNPSVAASMVRDSGEGHVEAGSGGSQQDLPEGRSSSHKTGSKVRKEGGTPYRPPAPLPSSSQEGPKTASGNDSQGWGGGAGEEISGID